MSGFAASPGNPYSAYFPSSPSCGCGSCDGGHTGLGRHSGTPGYEGEMPYRGMGDLTTIGTDLAAGDFASVISDLSPLASTMNMLIYGAGIAAWWFLRRKGNSSSAGSSTRRRALAAARRKATAILADAAAA